MTMAKNKEMMNTLAHGISPDKERDCKAVVSS